MKLNLGCGNKKMEGYVNVDLYGDPDVRVDLEQFPWPWADNSVDEIQLVHVLEHLGETKTVFISVMKELYRVCKDGAKINIEVPHFKSDDFFNDPTHIRPITAQGLGLFSQIANRESQKQGWASSTLGLDYGVDFHLESVGYIPSNIWLAKTPEADRTAERLQMDSDLYFNMIADAQFILRVLK